MTESAFDVIGPSMIGPSSSHTAGAVRIGQVARFLAMDKVSQVELSLHGSFAETGKGHATDRGLVAGLLGFAADDDRLKDALTLAKKSGLSVDILSVDLGDDYHPNTAKISFEDASGFQCTCIGSSVGGGMIRMVAIDDFKTDFSGHLQTLVLWHRDRPGLLATWANLIACVQVNIATVKVSRRYKGTEALTLVELDAPLPQEALSLLAKIDGVERCCLIPKIA